MLSHNGVNCSYEAADLLLLSPSSEGSATSLLGLEFAPLVHGGPLTDSLLPPSGQCPPCTTSVSRKTADAFEASGDRLLALLPGTLKSQLSFIICMTLVP